MKMTSKLINFSLSALLLAASSSVGAQEAASLSGLLNLVESDKVSESAEYRERLQEFEQNAARQAQILETTKEREKRLRLEEKLSKAQAIQAIEVKSVSDWHANTKVATWCLCRLTPILLRRN